LIGIKDFSLPNHFVIKNYTWIKLCFERFAYL